MKPPAPTPKPQPPEAPPRSWWMPTPMVLCASDNSMANDRVGVASIGRIIMPGVAPGWEVRPVSSSPSIVGYIAQTEGPSQDQTALDFLRDKPNPRAVIGIGGTDPEPFRRIGVNTYLVELNPQPNNEGGGGSWEPYGNYEKMKWQVEQQGWDHVLLNLGVYGSVALADYAAYHPQVTSDGGATWHTSPTAQGYPSELNIYSADGMGDTNSWPTLAEIAK